MRMTLTEALKAENKPKEAIYVGLNDVLRFEDGLRNKPKPNFFKEVAKAVPRSFESMAAGVGATLRWFGEISAEEIRRKDGINIEKRMYEKLAEWGDTAHKFWRKESQLGIEAPNPDVFRGSFMQNPSWTRGIAIIAEATPSLALATAVAIATKNPIAGAASLGLLEGSEQYIEAREAGKTVNFASGTGVLSTIGNTILEILPITRFMRGGSRKLGKDIFIGMIQEGSEEVLQALWQNSIAKIGYDKTRDLTEGMVEGFIGGAGSGGMIGGITSGRGIKTDTLIGEAIEKGIPKKDIEAMQEAVKKQIVDKADAIEEAISGEKVVLPRKEVAKPPIVREIVKPEQVIGRIKEMREKYKTEPARTKQEIKAVQTELIGMLDTIGLEAKDKAKFIKTIKNIQTIEQYQIALKDVQVRAERYIESTRKTKIEAKIKKELKAVKPLKVGQRRVGKYDYASNKFFQALREFQKLTKEKAQIELDAMPAEPTAEADLMKKRFLSLQAAGKTASAALFQKVYEDIKVMKAIGTATKSEIEFAKALERQEKVNKALQAIDKIKGNKKTIKTKIGNIYRRGFSNIYSMLNSIGGKVFAEEHDPLINENNRDTAIYFETKRIVSEASRIYDDKNVVRVFENMAKGKYKLMDLDGLTTEVGKLELIDIYNSLKNDSVRKRYHHAFGEAQIQNLMGELTTEDMAFADYLQEAVQEYREVFNQRSIETTGRDLGFVENYWPATSEYKENVYDDIRIQGETPSAMKERAKGMVIPKPMDAWFKAQRHIAQGEHVDNLSGTYETLKRLFTDRKMKHSIEEKFGKDVYNVLRNQIDNLSLNSQIAKIDAVSGAFKIAINNWVTAKIALNPSTFVRQLLSVGNYMEVMPAGEWTRLFFEGIKTPKATFDFMWQNAPFLEARFNRGYTEAIKDAISGAEKLSANWGNWSKFLSSFARVGDITAIIYGGYSLVKSEIAKGRSLKEAMVVFEAATLKAQQSGLSTSLSQFQNSKNPFARLFLAFKNTANQYFRKLADAVITYHNKDISTKEFAKIILIYGAIQPALYATSGILVKEAMKGLGRAIGLRDDEEEDIVEKIIDSIMVQLVVSPVNAVPILSDAVQYAMRKVTGQKAWKIFSTPFLDDLETGLSKLTKKDITAADYLKAAGAVLEPITAAPINTFIRFYEYIAGDSKNRAVTFK